MATEEEINWAEAPAVVTALRDEIKLLEKHVTAMTTRMSKALEYQQKELRRLQEELSEIRTSSPSTG